MDPKVNYFAVGLFVIILSAAVVFFTLWMAFGVDKQVYNTYLIYLSESVSGLSVEAPVKFNGVNVGSVTDIRLTPHNPEQVTVEIAVQADTPISADTRATLRSQGITGLSFVSLSGGNAHSPKLSRLPGQAYPVIQSAPSLMVKIDTTIQTLSDSLMELNKSVSYLLRKENQDNVTKLLKSMAMVSGDLAKQQDSLGLTLQALPLLTKNLANAAASASQAYSNINSQLSQGLLWDLNNAMVDLKDNPSMLIRGRTLPPLGPGEE